MKQMMLLMLMLLAGSAIFSQNKPRKKWTDIINSADSVVKTVKTIFPGKNKQQKGQSKQGTGNEDPSSDRQVPAGKDGQKEKQAITSEQVDYNGQAIKAGAAKIEVPANMLPLANYRDSLQAVYEKSAKGKTVRMAVSPFFDASIQRAPGRTLAQRMIAYMQVVPCFNVEPEYVYYVPGGTQVLITGTFKDYFESEKALGRPRICFELELRSASTQQLIKKYTVKKEGALYSGKGNNAALEDLWHACMFEATIFLLDQTADMIVLPKATEEKVTILDSAMYFQQRVQTESVFGQQQRYNEVKRERNHQMNLGTSEYYNDTILYNSYPKIKPDEFFEYSINGKKYQFSEGAKTLDKNVRLEAVQGITWARRDGIKINISSVNFVGEMKIGLFDPSSYPTTRRFYFGDSDIGDERVPGAREEVEIAMTLLGGFKEDKFTLKQLPTEKYLVIATNKEQNLQSNTISSGYVQVLHFETGLYGVIELLFHFKTKQITDQAGKVTPAKTIEGRIRARGNISPPVRM